MPRFVDELPKTERGRSRKYDFTALYAELDKNGKAVELTQGDDFDCSGDSIRQYLYRDAPENGFKVKVRQRVEDDGTEDGRAIVTFSASKLTAEDKRKMQERQAKAKNGSKSQKAEATASK